MIPDISIIMPVYNAQDFLDETILSILNQSFKNFELIIINDGSIDESEAICNRYVKNDSRVRLFNKKNEGICRARNLGLDLARGEYIGFCDHDDIMDVNLLKDNYNLLVKNNAEWVKFGKKEYIYQSNNLTKKTSSNFEKKVYYNNELKEKVIELRKKDLLTYVWDSLFKKSIIVEHKLTFDDNFKYGNEDIDFCQQYIKNCSKLVVNDKNYYNHYTRLGVSTSSKFSIGKIDSHIYLAKKSLDVFEDYNVDFHKYETLYNYLIAKYIVFNICQDLNRAGNDLEMNEKKEILSKIFKEDIFEVCINFSWNSLYEVSKKMAIYLFLFKSKRFRLLLTIDKFSRIIIYKIREVRSKIKPVKNSI